MKRLFLTFIIAAGLGSCAVFKSPPDQIYFNGQWYRVDRTEAHDVFYITDLGVYITREQLEMSQKMTGL
jgi:hypothetical protein